MLYSKTSYNNQARIH